MNWKETLVFPPEVPISEKAKDLILRSVMNPWGTGRYLKTLQVPRQQWHHPSHLWGRGRRASIDLCLQRDPTWGTCRCLVREGGHRDTGRLRRGRGNLVALWTLNCHTAVICPMGRERACLEQLLSQMFTWGYLSLSSVALK